MPPGYDDDPSGAIRRSTSSRATRARGRCGTTARRFARRSPRPSDALFAGGDAPAVHRGARGRVDRVRRQPVRRLARDGPVPLLPLRRGRPVRRRAYRTLASAAHRGIAGKSSGGFGAMITPMLRPDLFGGLASHAGDALYELSYIQGFGKVVRALRAYDGSYEKFWEDFASRPPMSKETDGDLVITYGVAAAFSADEDGTVHLPFDLQTGRLVDDVWARWLAWDPVRMVPAPRRCAARPARDLPRRRHPRRVVPGARGARVPRRARRDRGHRRRLRALRRGARRHRLPLPARPGVPRRALDERP